MIDLRGDLHVAADCGQRMRRELEIFADLERLEKPLAELDAEYRRERLRLDSADLAEDANTLDKHGGFFDLQLAFSPFFEVFLSVIEKVVKREQRREVGRKNGEEAEHFVAQLDAHVGVAVLVLLLAVEAPLEGDEGGVDDKLHHVRLELQPTREEAREAVER